MIVYIALTVLVTINIYKFIIKDQKWKIIPLLFFYILAFLAITCRAITEVFYLKMYLSYELWTTILDQVNDISKFSVGLIQAWTMLELTIRMRKLN